MGQSKSCSWKSPELQCKLQRNPCINSDNAEEEKLSQDNKVISRSNVKLLPSPTSYDRSSDHVNTKSFMLIDFKRHPYYHDREQSLIGCEVHLSDLHILYITLTLI